MDESIQSCNLGCWWSSQHPFELVSTTLLIIDESQITQITCLLSSPARFNFLKVDMLARCDKAIRVDNPWDRGPLRWASRCPDLAKSQVIGISGLWDVGYTLGL
jgi:hypothetical protein